MATGFIADAAHTTHMSVQPRWVAGEPETGSWLTGYSVKTQGKRVYPVITFRCDQCGYLESYARPDA
jgi:hypothetical protein